MSLTNTPAAAKKIGFFCEEPFKRFARIEGIATLEPEGIRFEYAMTQGVTPTPKGTVSKLLLFSDLVAVEARHHWISATKIRFRARTLKCIDSYPTTDPSAFEIEVLGDPRNDVEAFVAAARASLHQG